MIKKLFFALLLNERAKKQQDRIQFSFRYFLYGHSRHGQSPSLILDVDIRLLYSPVAVEVGGCRNYNSVRRVSAENSF